MELKNLVREIADFPEMGRNFKDITPILQRAEVFQETINLITNHFKDWKIDIIAPIEGIGFLIGAPLAFNLNTGLSPIRRPGELPGPVRWVEFEKEQDSIVLEIHDDSIQPGDRVLIVDSILATGNTSLSAARLIQEQGGKVVGFSYLAELKNCRGRLKLVDFPVHSIIQFEE